MEKRVVNRDLETLVMRAEVVKASGDHPHALSFVASDETQDSYGDVIKVDGWELERFRSNPVFLWGHDRRSPPIGKVSKVARDTKPVATETGAPIQHKVLRADVAFATDVSGEQGSFARSVYDLYERGYLAGVSVSFRPIEMVEPKSDEEANALGVGIQDTPWGKQYGILFKRQELLELSAVTIPANPNALKLSADARELEARLKAMEQELKELRETNARLASERLEKALHQLSRRF